MLDVKQLSKTKQNKQNKTKTKPKQSEIKQNKNHTKTNKLNNTSSEFLRALIGPNERDGRSY